MSDSRLKVAESTLVGFFKNGFAAIFGSSAFSEHRLIHFERAGQVFASFKLFGHQLLKSLYQNK